jgi:hypothetical protein
MIGVPNGKICVISCRKFASESGERTGRILPDLKCGRAIVSRKDRKENEAETSIGGQPGESRNGMTDSVYVFVGRQTSSMPSARWKTGEPEERVGRMSDLNIAVSSSVVGRDGRLGETRDSTEWKRCEKETPFAVKTKRPRKEIGRADGEDIRELGSGELTPGEGRKGAQEVTILEMGGK